MATISTTFGFQDQITSGLQQLNSVLSQLTQALSSVNNASQGAGTSLDHVGDVAERTADKSSKTLEKLLTFNMAKTVFDTVKGAIDGVTASMDEMNSMYLFQITQENKLATVMRSRMGANDEMIQDIKDYASSLQETGIIGDEVMLSGAQELATYISDAETLKALLPTLNDIAVQASPDMNISAQSYTGIATMLGKVMGGSLGGMSDRGWVFTEEEKAAFTQMNELQRAQFLASYAKDAIGTQNMDAAKTAQGQIVQLNNTIGDMKEEVGRALQPFIALKSLVGGNWQIKFYDTIIKALNFIRENAGLTIAIIGAVTVALGVLAVSLIVVNHAAIAAKLAMIGAWIAAAAPILIVIGLLGAVVVILSKVFGAANIVGGFLGGVFGFVATVVQNTVKTIGNAFISAWNFIASFAEFLWNVFNSPIAAIKGLFLNLADTMASVLSPVSGIIDSIFGTKLTQSLASFKDTMKESKQNLGKDYKTIKRFDTFQLNGVVSGTIEGGKKGIEVAHKFEDTLKNFNMKGGIGGLLSPTESQGIENMNNFAFGSNGALKTEDKGFVEISNDYKELLSNMATRRFNNIFKNVEPSVNVGGIVIHKESQPDEILQIITKAVTDVSSSSLESESA